MTNAIQDICPFCGSKITVIVKSKINIDEDMMPPQMKTRKEGKQKRVTQSRIYVYYLFCNRYHPVIVLRIYAKSATRFEMQLLIFMTCIKISTEYPSSYWWDESGPDRITGRSNKLLSPLIPLLFGQFIIINRLYAVLYYSI